MRKIRSIKTRLHGFTVVEFMVASTLGLLVIGLALSALVMNRSVFRNDIVRTKLNQNVRSGMDIIGLNVRQAGESLDEFFPAVLLIDGASGAPDELVLRRNLYENEILNVCQNLVSGSHSPSIIVAFDTTSSGCSYTTSLQPYLTTWNNYAVSEGGTAKAYVYNRSTRLGEFFEYIDTLDDVDDLEMLVNRSSGNWENDYPGDGLSSAMYLLEEIRFRLNDGVLQMVKNGDTANALNVVDGITDFQVSITLAGGASMNSFTTTDEWTEIDFIQVTMVGEEEMAAGNTISSSVTAQLFPRNILSH